MSVDDLREAELGRRLHILPLALSFVLGLAFVFTLLGASASAAGELLLSFRPLLLKLGGLLIVLFGLHLLGVFRLPFLVRERRLEFASYGNGGPGRAFLMGGAFAPGWTPCIGPLLAGIFAASGAVLIGLGLLVFSGRMALISVGATSTFGLGLAR